MSTKNNILNKTCTYLAGPIQFTVDGGREWRKDITPLLKDIGIEVLDPTDKQCKYKSEGSDNVLIWKQMRENGEYEKLYEYIKNEIIRPDLRMVDVSDFLIAFVHQDIHTCGTYHEIINAINQKKRIFLLSESIDTVPGWLLGLIKPCYVFSSIESIVEHLKNINNGTLEDKSIIKIRFGV